MAVAIALLVSGTIALVLAAWALLDDGEGRCEVCGGRYLRVKVKGGKWRWVCRQCGHEWDGR